MDSKTDIYNKLVVILGDEFELDANGISMDMNLYKDLDLDSIDAIDLVIRLQEITGKKIDPDTFKSVRTVGDVVNSLDEIVNPQVV